MSHNFRENFELEELDLSQINDCGLHDDVIICECFCVNAGDIRKMFEAEKEVDFDKLRSVFGFGEGCKSCLKNQDYWKNNIF